MRMENEVQFVCSFEKDPNVFSFSPTCESFILQNTQITKLNSLEEKIKYNMRSIVLDTTYVLMCIMLFFVFDTSSVSQCKSF